MISKNSAKFDYSKEINLIKSSSPHRLYFLCGPEDYLKESYFSELKQICLGDDDCFSYKSFSNDDFNDSSFMMALNLMPFTSERTFVELRDVDFSKLNESLFSNIPDYCTVVVINKYDPDQRLKITKYLIDNSKYLYFDKQDKDKLVNWITRRFNSYNKEISKEAAERLIFVSGEYMSILIPEITKIASYSNTGTVSVDDINLIAHHIPEADTFEMLNCISNKKFNLAIKMLGDLISNKENQPTVIIAAIGYNLRKLFGQKLLNKYVSFSLNNLKNDIEYCSYSEYSIKKYGADEIETLKNIVLHIITNESK